MKELSENIKKLSDKNKIQLLRYIKTVLAWRDNQITGKIISNVSQGTVLKIGAEIPDLK